MSTQPVTPVTPEPAPVADPSRSRRSILRAGAAGLAGLALGALGRPATAHAAAGGPIVMGATNDAGTTNTSLNAWSTGSAFQVNQGSTGVSVRATAAYGLAGSFTSTRGDSVSSVTGNAAKYGLYASNDAAAAGNGAAIRANGKLNRSLVATSDSTALPTIEVTNSNTTSSNGYVGGVGVLGLQGGAKVSDLPAPYPSAGQFIGVNGVLGFSPSAGYGTAGVAMGDDAAGVVGEVEGSNASGVWALALGADSVAVDAENYSTGTSPAILAISELGGDTDTGGAGVLAFSFKPEGTGLFGISTEVGGWGVAGIATGDTAGESGVSGFAGTGVPSYGVYGETAGASGSGSFGVYSMGDAHVEGDLSYTGALIGPITLVSIDHPLDPANKTLQHSAVLSSEMKDVYDGVVTLDAKGEAVVTLPDWFEALNKDVRYQLTAIGPLTAPLFVKSEVAGGKFSIGGGAAGQRVCWMVSGVRKDAWADKHRPGVEVAKPKAQKGLYLHPTEAGKSAAAGIDAARRAKSRKLQVPAFKRKARPTKLPLFVKKS